MHHRTTRERGGEEVGVVEDAAVSRVKVVSGRKGDADDTGGREEMKDEGGQATVADDDADDVDEDIDITVPLLGPRKHHHHHSA